MLNQHSSGSPASSGKHTSQNTRLWTSLDQRSSRGTAASGCLPPGTQCTFRGGHEHQLGQAARGHYSLLIIFSPSKKTHSFRVLPNRIIWENELQLHLERPRWVWAIAGELSSSFKILVFSGQMPFVSRLAVSLWCLESWCYFHFYAEFHQIKPLHPPTPATQHTLNFRNKNCSVRSSDSHCRGLSSESLSPHISLSYLQPHPSGHLLSLAKGDSVYLVSVHLPRGALSVGA